MRAKDATLLTSKLNQLQKMVSSIITDPEHPGSESLKSNGIVLLNGLKKDVKIIFENDKRYRLNQAQNSDVFKTGYPCKPIKPRKQRGKNANNSSLRNGGTD